MQDHLTCEDEKEDEVEVEESLMRGSKKILPAVQYRVRHTVMCSKLENKLFTLNFQEKCKEIIILDWLRNEIYSV